ncbi:MAG: nuclear transport factor 2 family protein [Pseudomonadota bacterium]
MISTGAIEDRLAIRELIESYNDAVMRFDEAAWAENWTEDATWNTGQGDLTGKGVFVPVWREAMSNFSFVGFFASAGPIIVEGDTAHGTWYQQEFLHQKAGGKMNITGRYEDDYVKRDGRWYFQKRIYSILNMEQC